MNNLQKITYHVSDNIDLHDVFSVVYVPEGKKEKTHQKKYARARIYRVPTELSTGCGIEL